jgi:hypothetical protein
VKIDNIEEEVTNDMENLRKKNEIEIQNKMEIHSSRKEETADRISELQEKNDNKRKNKRTVS